MLPSEANIDHRIRLAMTAHYAVSAMAATLVHSPASALLMLSVLGTALPFMARRLRQKALQEEFRSAAACAPDDPLQVMTNEITREAGMKNNVQVSRYRSCFFQAVSTDQRIFVSEAVEELEKADQKAVLAHEVAHLKGGDCDIRTHFLLTAPFYFSMATFFYAMGMAFKNNFATQSALLVGVPFTAFIANRVLIASMSRLKEYRADDEAVRLIANPPAVVTMLDHLHQKEVQMRPWVALPQYEGNLMDLHPPTHFRAERLRRKYGLPEAREWT